METPVPLQSAPVEYREWLRSLKDEIRQVRRRSALAVNAEMVLLYWRIGREILDRQAEHGWGARVIDLLADDLHAEFPDVRGFSPRNLKYMRKFAATRPDAKIVQGVLARLPWYQNVALMDKVREEAPRLWYAQAAIQHGWTRDILVHQIGTKLHERQGRAITNFASTMEPAHAASAIDLFKDPYVLDFVEIAADAHERHLEKALIDRVKDLLLELGKGFSFMGSQYHLDFSGQDYYIDLLFYHTKLHSHVIIELKMRDFEPEFAGKMNFYLAAVDDKLRTEGDNPSIGLILCRGKNGLVVEYALRDINKPMAVSEYTVLPPEIASALPSPDVIEARLGDHLGVQDERSADDDSIGMLTGEP